MNGIPNINLAAYTYQLPDALIAEKPTQKREQSRLLQYNRGAITHHTFDQIISLVPEDATLFFNDTKVIPARLFFQKKTGAKIEIFLLEPVSLGGEMERVMQTTYSCTWKCMVGNQKKWKEEELILETPTATITAKWVNREAREIQFNWDSGATFSEILVETGKIPLPPYIKREASDLDQDRYQTVYAAPEGAVAAPTAGLHFTSDILKTLQERGHHLDFLTLHVGAGTFQPISTSRIAEHPMHGEHVSVSLSNILSILESPYSIAVGTTCVRTLESLYWFGVMLSQAPDASFFIEKDYPYRAHPDISVETSMKNITNYMERHSLSQLKGTTEILIVPGYSFKIVQGLVTNFHLPESTLILLIAAFIGNDWEKIYQQAKEEGYRFLSYGDSSLLIT